MIFVFVWFPSFSTTVSRYIHVAADGIILFFFMAEHGDILEKEMATYSSILALENPVDRGAWQATVHGVGRVGHDSVTKPWRHF